MGTAQSTDTVSANQEESILHCSICHEIFTEPRTLPCHHSFCKHCLTNFVRRHRRQKAADEKTETLPCPECRSTFTLKSEAEVERMGCSHFIKNMHDLMIIQQQAKVKTLKCSRCEQQAVCRCCTCTVFMCEKCSNLHEAWHNMKKHTVLSLTELTRPENEDKLKPKVYCNKHEKGLIKLYCETCQELICRVCTDVDHARPDHVFHPLAEVAKKQREVLRSHCDMLQEQLKKGKESLELFPNTKQLSKNNAKKAKDEIDEHRETILKTFIKKLDEKVEQLKKEVDENFKEVDEAIVKQEVTVKDYVNKVESCSRLINSLFEKGNNEEILSSQKLVEENVKRIEQQQPNVMKPIHDGCITYIKLMSDNEAVDCIGKLTEKMGKIGSYVRKQSNSSFIFSLQNKDNLPSFKAPIKPDEYQYAICCHPNYGPTFGRSHDLYISNNFNTNQYSFTIFHVIDTLTIFFNLHMLIV